VLVPVMYSLLDDLDDFVKRNFMRPEDEEDELVPGVKRSGARPAVSSGSNPAPV